MCVLSWCGKRECAHREAAKADGKIFITLCMLSFFIEVSADSPSNAFGKTITVGGDYRTVGDINWTIDLIEFAIPDSGGVVTIQPATALQYE